MPYTADHKARTRARIVDAARRLFNRRGFEEVSIDQIMAEAGLTRGGFYNHFSSKDQLYTAAVASYVSCSPFRTELARAPVPVTDPQRLARMLVDLYLSDEVMADQDLHCPLYALPSDIARAGLPPRKAYTQLIRGIEGVFQRALAGADAGRRAQALVALCVGGMVLARTTDDGTLRKSMRAATRRQALELLEAAA